MPIAMASSSSTSKPRAINKNQVQYRGHAHFRQRVVLSILSGKSVRIDAIRADQLEVGVQDYEVSFLRLIEKVTNGTSIVINETGTSVLVRPGTIPGGKYTHTCPTSRSIGYFLEAVIPLGVFGKVGLEIKFDGITGEEGRDLTVDMIRTVTLPHLHLFGIADGLELQIKKRGAAPLGGGQVIFKCPVVRNVKTLNFVDGGKIKRIRGIAYSTRVSPQFANRMVDAARSVLNRYIPDIYLYTDVYKGEESGKSPGYGLTLLSLSTTSALHAAEALSLPPPAPTRANSIASIEPNVMSNTFQTPEDLALHASRLLLEQIGRGGCVDEAHQWLVMLMMVLGKEDVGRCKMGKLTAHSVQYLRDINDFFGVKFKVAPVAGSADHTDHEEVSKAEEKVQEEDGDIVMQFMNNKEKKENQQRRLVPQEIMVSCLGVGYSNINKSIS